MAQITLISPNENHVTLSTQAAEQNPPLFQPVVANVDPKRCPGCKNTIVHPRVLLCGHTLCEKCFESRLKDNSQTDVLSPITEMSVRPVVNINFREAECPVCGKPFTHSYYMHVPLLETLLQENSLQSLQNAQSPHEKKQAELLKHKEPLLLTSDDLMQWKNIHETFLLSLGVREIIKLVQQCMPSSDILLLRKSSFISPDLCRREAFFDANMPEAPKIWCILWKRSDELKNMLAEKGLSLETYRFMFDEIMIVKWDCLSTPKKKQNTLQLSSKKKKTLIGSASTKKVQRNKKCQ